MNPKHSRRAVLSAAAIIAGAAACSRAVRHSNPPSTSRAAAGSSTSSAPAAPSSTASAPTGPSVEVGNGPRTRQEVALTFHGSGNPALATELFAAVSAHGIPITVFAVGTWLAANPTMAKIITDHGYELANHTYTHPTLSDLDAAATTTEIAQCRDLLVKQSGSPGAYFRQSGAQHSTPLIRSIAGQLGYPVCLSYDVDSLDWTDPGVSVIQKQTATATGGSIVSMHLGHAGTISAMPGILADLASRGLTPVTVSQLLRA